MGLYVCVIRGILTSDNIIYDFGEVVGRLLIYDFLTPDTNIIYDFLTSDTMS